MKVRMVGSTRKGTGPSPQVTGGSPSLWWRRGRRPTAQGSAGGGTVADHVTAPELDRQEPSTRAGHDPPAAGRARRRAGASRPGAGAPAAPRRTRTPASAPSSLDRDGAVVGEGCHRGAGTPHAEVDALAQAGERARGGTAYVTLEPCNHTGRTGPCAARAVMPRVCAASCTPRPTPARPPAAARNPARGRGGGGRRRAGRRGAGAQPGLDPSPSSTGRPWVTWKFATTLDGRSAAADGTQPLDHRAARPRRRPRPAGPLRRRPGRHRHRAGRRPPPDRPPTRRLALRPAAAARRSWGERDLPPDGPRPRRRRADAGTCAPATPRRSLRRARRARRSAHVWLEGGPTAGGGVHGGRPGRRGRRLRRAGPARRAAARRWATSASPRIDHALRLTVRRTSRTLGDGRPDHAPITSPQGEPLMFTGIVEELGHVVALERGADSARLTRARARSSRQRRRARRLDRRQRRLPDRGRARRRAVHASTSWPRRCSAAASATSRRVTGSTSSAPWPPSSRFGGHIVQGHVDGTATILERTPGDRWEVVTFSLPARARPLRRREGLDHRRRGQPHRRRPSATTRSRVSLIPTTLALTTLGHKGVGDPRQPRGRRASPSTSSACSPPSTDRRTATTTHPKRRPRHELARAALRRPADHRRPRRSSGARSSATSSASPPRSAACAAGSGPGRSASSATPCCSPSSSAWPSPTRRAHDALRPGRPADLLHHHQRLRLVALEPDPPGQPRGAARTCRPSPRGGRRRGSAWLYLGFWVGGVVVAAVAVLRDRRRLAGAALVLLVRRLDLRRLDRRDLRDGPRLERLLAGLDRGRPRRRPAAGALAASTPRPCCTPCTRGLVIYGFFVWLRGLPRRARPEPRAERGDGMIALATIEAALDGPARAAGRCSSPTTRTARTRATSSSPPQTLDRPSGWRGRSGTPRASSARRCPASMADRLGLPPMVARQRGPARHGLHRLGRRARPASARASARRTAPTRCGCSPTPPPPPPTWRGPGTCSRCGRATAECCSERATPRRPSTCAGWPGSRRWASSPSWSTTTAR